MSAIYVWGLRLSSGIASDSRFLVMITLQSSSWWLKFLNPCLSSKRRGWNSCLLNLDWPLHGYCRLLGSESEDLRSVSPCLCLPYLSEKTKSWYIQCFLKHEKLREILFFVKQNPQNQFLYMLRCRYTCLSKTRYMLTMTLQIKLFTWLDLYGKWR